MKYVIFKPHRHIVKVTHLYWRKNQVKFKLGINTHRKMFNLFALINSALHPFPPKAVAPLINKFFSVNLSALRVLVVAPQGVTIVAPQEVITPAI
jgi:hypothetical protein